MKIVITEKQQRHLSYTLTVGRLVEQKRVKKDSIILKDIVQNISTDLNTLLPKLAGDEESTWKVEITGNNPNNLKLNFQGEEYGFKQVGKNIYVIDVYNYRVGTTSKEYGSKPIIKSNFAWQLKIPNLFNKFIEAYPEYSYLFEGKLENDYQSNNIKKQINNVVVNIGFEPSGPGTDGYNPGIYFELTKNDRKFRKSTKSNDKFSLGTPFSFYELVNATPGKGTLVGNLNNDTSALLYHSDTRKVLSKVKITPPPPAPQPTPEPEPEPDVFAREIVFTFQVTDPFEFDSPGLTDNAEASIKNEMNKVYALKEQGFLEDYLKTKINGKDIIVNAYSSIDAKSDDIGGGAVKECKPGKVTRKKYNLCLSQKRAETIVNHLKSTYSDIFGKANLIAKGMGELKSPNSVDLPYNDPKAKKHRDEKRVATQKDRKFVINLPPYKGEIIEKK